MNLQQTKNELQNIISGKSSSSYDAVIQTVTNYLRSGQRTSPMAEEKHQYKKEETKKLELFAERNNLILNYIDEADFISSGAEQKVYIKDGKSVIKLNDCIYYASWEDYFYNLLLNNYFFADTAYKLIGFYKSEKEFYAVVEQQFIKSDEITDLNKVQLFLQNNGFKNTKNNDYYHPQLGIILEDLHDENVLTCNSLLYFIDTVFYIDSEIFWT
jgi:hypothetical protein